MGELARDSICTLVEYITQDAALCSWSRRVYLTNLIQDECCVFFARLAPGAIFASYVAVFGGSRAGARRGAKKKSAIKALFHRVDRRGQRVIGR